MEELHPSGLGEKWLRTNRPFMWLSAEVLQSSARHWGLGWKMEPHEADGPRLLLHPFSSYLFLCLPPLCTDVHTRPVNEHYHKQGIPLKSSHTDAGKVIYHKIRLIIHMEFTTAHSNTISVLHDEDFIAASAVLQPGGWGSDFSHVSLLMFAH